MFSFAWPWMILLLPLPFLVRLMAEPFASSDKEQGPEVRFPFIERLKAGFSGKSADDRKSGTGLLIILSFLWICLTGTLMQPEIIDQFTHVKTKGHDMMLAVDLSGSMHALDFSTDDVRVDRLDVIKAVVGKFVQERKGDRVGLILFGSNAYLRLPLTFDTLSVGKMLNNTQVGEAGDATAIGDAIGVAVRNLRSRPEQSRVLVLLTDGGDNASTIPPLQAAKLAAQYGIRIYTIGIGSSGPVPIADENGNIVMGEFDLDEELLKKIADITGGSYFRATDTGALEQIYSHINQLEKTESESHSYLIRTPLYRYPLGAAMVLLLLAGFAPLTRRFAHGI